MVVDFLKKQKAAINAHRTNVRGKRIPGRFLIIESDDWGAIRTPSKQVLEAFEKQGLDIAHGAFKYDSLASNEDLDALFNLLQSLRDGMGNPLKITANAIMANPDFRKIKAANFTQFYFEDFRNTLLRYPAHDKAFLKWQQGITEQVFMPQFHGREHLQYNRWLKVLQSGDEAALFCFDRESTYSGKGDYSFMEAYDWDEPADVEKQKKILAEGLTMFKNAFGFASKSFIAPCYNWDPAIEITLKTKGVTLLQGLRNQLVPTGSFDQYSSMPHYFGESNSLGLQYTIRNCFLEPSQLPGKDWVDSCLAQIQSAFMWQKPAVICSHRINYIGFIDQKNRDRGLNDLKVLTKRVLRKWPDVQFISTDQLDELLSTKQIK
jgi:hypothetical protein